MGANASTAIATAVAEVSANTTVNVNEACAANQDIQFDPVNVVIGSVNCTGGVNISNISVTQNATCNNTQQIAILSKIVADQAAKTDSSTGLGFLNNAIALSSTFIDMQNNIAAFMSSSCYNSQRVVVGKQTYQVGNVISGGLCNIALSNFSQNSACVNDIMAQITNDNQLSQVATATATAGVDLGELLGILFVIFLIMALLFLAVPLVTAGIGGKALGKLFKLPGDDGVPISELRAKLRQLQNAVEAIQERMA